MKISRRRVLLAGTAMAALLTSHGAQALYRAAATPLPGQPITTFNVQNWSVSASPGFLRFGMPFAEGDVTNGTVPVLTVDGVLAPAQFDMRNTHSDGSLKLAICTANLSAFTGSQNKACVVSAVAGAFNNTGIYSPSDVATYCDYEVKFTSAQSYNGTNRTTSPDNGTYATYGSGSFTASLNDALSVPTRVTKIRSGPVCEGWQCWAMAVDDATSQPDAHLQVMWEVYLWKNTDGSVADVEVKAIPAQVWFNSQSAPFNAPKYRLDYFAALTNNGTTVYSYTSPGSYSQPSDLRVKHPYQSAWAAVRTDDDNNEGRAPWLNAIPTLTYKPEKLYWIKTGFVPPLDTTLAPNSNAAHGYTARYVPLSAENHRPVIDGTGGYMGRGMLPNVDSVTFLSPTAENLRASRVSSYAGLHVGYWYHSNAQRTRPGDGSADVANTVISVRYFQAPDDFTADGMPPPVQAYVQSSNGAVTADPAYLSYTPYLGGQGVWTLGPATTHAVAYSYFMYLMEGDWSHLHANECLFTNGVHCRHGNTVDGAPQFTYLGVPGFDAASTPPGPLSIPSTQFSGIACSSVLSSPRQAGWAFMLGAYAAGIVPDDFVEANFIKSLDAQQWNYTTQNAVYFVPEQIATGIYSLLPQVLGHGNYYTASQWMNSFLIQAAAMGWRMNKNTAAFNFLNTFLANQVRAYTTKPFYNSAPERVMTIGKPTTAVYDATTNPILAPQDFRFLTSIATADTTTGRVTLAANATAQFAQVSENDPLWIVGTSYGINSQPIPAGFVEGQQYYAVNVTGGNSFQIAATPGGAPLPINLTTLGICGIWEATQSLTTLQSPPSNGTGWLTSADQYYMIALMDAVLCALCGLDDFDSAIVDKFLTGNQNTEKKIWMTWWGAVP